MSEIDRSGLRSGGDGVGAAAAYTGTYIAATFGGHLGARVAVPAGCVLDGSVPFTIDMFVRAEAANDGACLLSQGDVLRLVPLDRGFEFYRAGMGTYDGEVRDSPFDPDGWNHLCASFDGTFMRLFVNGEGTFVSTVQGAGTASAAELVVGAGFAGSVRFVRTFSRAVSASEALTLLSCDYDDLAAAGFADSLTAYLDFSLADPQERVGGGQIDLGGDACVNVFSPGLVLAGGACAAISNEPDCNPAGRGNEPFTVQAWVMLDPGVRKTLCTVFANGDPGQDAGLSLFAAKEDDGWRMCVERACDGVLAAGSTCALRTWVNVCVTYDGVDALRLYMNGVESAMLTGCAPVVDALEEPLLRIGAEPGDETDNGDGSFEGVIGRVDVWTVCLTAEQVASCMTASPALDAEGLAFSCDFAAGSVNNLVSTNPVGLRNGAALGERRVFAKGAAGIVGAGVIPAARDGVAVAADGLVPLLWAGGDAGRPLTGLLSAGELAAERDRALSRLPEDLAARVGDSENPARFMLVTSAVRDGRTVFVAHYPDESYVYDVIDVELDEETAWWIELFAMILLGSLALLSGIKVSGGSKVTTLILRRIYATSWGRSLLGGGKVTFYTILSLLYMLKTKGVLSDFLKEALRGMRWFKLVWTVACFVATVVSIWAGVGLAYYLIAFADLVVSVGVHIANKPGLVALTDVGLTSITFALGAKGASSVPHDVTSACAFPIKTDGMKAIPVPEWRASSKVQDRSGHNVGAAVAYAVSQVEGKSITLRVDLSSAEASRGIAVIRAVDLSETESGASCLLGTSQEATATFVNQRASGVEVSFPSHKLDALGVFKGRLKLGWEVKDGDAWKRFAVSCDPIYVTLAAPCDVWSDDGLRPLVWIGVLDLATSWAKGKTTPEQVMGAITEKVNKGLGFKYDTQRGASSYVLIRQTKSGALRTVCFMADMVALKYKKVNCTDCAAFVSAFSAALGCDMNKLHIVNKGSPYEGQFEYRPMISIGGGENDWHGGRFLYHEIVGVRKEGATADADWHVYDACCTLNRELDESKPKVRMLPIGLAYCLAGTDDEATYLEHFAVEGPNGMGCCKLTVPLESVVFEKDRASFLLQWCCDHGIEEVARFCPERLRSDFAGWPEVGERSDRGEEALALPGSDTLAGAGWDLADRRVTWGLPGSCCDKVVALGGVEARVSVHVLPSPDAARTALASILARSFAVRAPEFMGAGAGPGDICHAGGGHVLFVRGSVLVWVAIDADAADADGAADEAASAAEDEAAMRLSAVYA